MGEERVKSRFLALARNGKIKKKGKGKCRGLVVFAFEPAVEPADVEVEAEGGVAEHFVGHAFGGVEVVDVAEGGSG
jgi:hypothetical protein